MDLKAFTRYKTGISKLDIAHYNLFLKLNDILLSLNTKEELVEHIEEFRNLTIEHFTSEEAFMKEIEFPYIESHKEAHAHILKKLNKLIGSADIINKHNIKMYFTNELDYILLKHIDHMDMQISEFLKVKNKTV